MEELDKGELVKYLSGEEFQKEKLPLVDVIKLLEDIINDEQIQESGLIEYIELTGSANGQVRELMKLYEIESLKLRDTRGFMDESVDKMSEFLQQTKEWKKDSEEYKIPKNAPTDEKEAYAQLLLDDRASFDNWLYLGKNLFTSLQIDSRSKDSRLVPAIFKVISVA